MPGAQLRKPGDPFLHRANGTDYAQGCRCTPCREANTARARKLKNKYRNMRVLIDGWMVATTTERHGFASTYTNHSCRCRPCFDAHAIKMEKARARRSRLGLKTPSERAKSEAAAARKSARRG